MFYVSDVSAHVQEHKETWVRRTDNTHTRTFWNPIKPGLWDRGPTCQMALSVCTSSKVCDSWQQDYGHERCICGFRPSDSILLARRKRANVSSAVWWLVSFDPRKGTMPGSSLFFIYLCAAEVWSHLCVCIFVCGCVCVRQAFPVSAWTAEGSQNDSTDASFVLQEIIKTK